LIKQKSAYLLIVIGLLAGCAANDNTRYEALQHGALRYQVKEIHPVNSGKNYTFCQHCLTFDNEKNKKEKEHGKG